jgi:hypothetical protein
MSTKIINIPLGAFGGPLRAGDMIAVCNVIEHFRREVPDLKFHIFQDAMQDSEHCKLLYQFLLHNTDYFSEEVGDELMSWKDMNAWDLRGIYGDLVKIPNKLTQQKKIVIIPVFDAMYNTYRNWPTKLMDVVLQNYSTEQFSDYEKIICHSNTISVQAEGWKSSTDYNENLNHVMTSEIYVGGDTGMSHFVGALENGPSQIAYLYSTVGLLHTTPFYLFHGKGRMNMFWQESYAN